jgi:hypothetical protein
MGPSTARLHLSLLPINLKLHASHDATCINEIKSMVDSPNDVFVDTQLPAIWHREAHSGLINAASIHWSRYRHPVQQVPWPLTICHASSCNPSSHGAATPTMASNPCQNAGPYGPTAVETMPRSHWKYTTVVLSPCIKTNWASSPIRGDRQWQSIKHLTY